LFSKDLSGKTKSQERRLLIMGMRTECESKATHDENTCTTNHVTRNMEFSLKKLLISVLAPLLFIAGTAHAEFLNFTPSSTFGGTAPTGYLSANFSDVGGGVQLAITSSLAQGESLGPQKAPYFNFNPAKDSILSTLVFALVSNTGFPQSATVMTGSDAFRAHGGGFFDIMFTYGAHTKPLTTGESQTYLITTTNGSINASDFTVRYQ
jgi:hypothetical protein